MHVGPVPQDAPAGTAGVTSAPLAAEQVSGLSGAPSADAMPSVHVAPIPVDAAPAPRGRDARRPATRSAPPPPNRPAPTMHRLRRPGTAERARRDRARLPREDRARLPTEDNEPLPRPRFPLMTRPPHPSGLWTQSPASGTCSLRHGCSSREGRRHDIFQLLGCAEVVGADHLVFTPRSRTPHGRCRAGHP